MKLKLEVLTNEAFDKHSLDQGSEICGPRAPFQPKKYILKTTRLKVL